MPDVIERLECPECGQPWPSGLVQWQHRCPDDWRNVPPVIRRYVAVDALDLVGMRAALAAYRAQYGARPVGAQHAIPPGAVGRIEAVVDALAGAVWAVQGDGER